MRGQAQTIQTQFLGGWRSIYPDLAILLTTNTPEKWRSFDASSSWSSNSFNLSATSGFSSCTSAEAASAEARSVRSLGHPRSVGFHRIPWDSDAMDPFSHGFSKAFPMVFLEKRCWCDPEIRKLTSRMPHFWVHEIALQFLPLCPSSVQKQSVMFRQ